MGLTMVSSFVLARLLSVEDRGLHQLFITTISYVITISCGGVGFSLVLGMKNKQYLYWQYYVLFFVVIALLISCISLILFDFTEYYLLFIINAILTSLSFICLEKSKIDAELKIYRKINLQQPILLVLIYGAAYLLLKEQPLKIVLYLLTFYNFIQAFLCLIYLFKIQQNFISSNSDVGNIKSKVFFKNWIKQNLLQVFGATTGNLDKFLISVLLGNYALGLYTVCIAFDSLLTRFINMLADYYYAGLINKLNRLKIVLIIIAVIGGLALIFVPLLAEPVVVFFFSSKYGEVSAVLIWFIINSILAGLSWVLSQNMLLLGKQILLFTRQLISILVFIILFYLLREYQLYGVAYALIGASLTRLFISIIYYFKYPITEIGYLSESS